MVHAVVIVTEKEATITVEEVVAFCKDHLASYYEAPKDVESVDFLPKNPCQQDYEKGIDGELLD